MAEETEHPQGWTDIKGIYYGFNDHCETKTYPGIHKMLRVALAETTDNINDYFTDSERTNFKQGNEVIKILRKSIIESIKEEATDTTKTERIEPIINSLPILFRYMALVNGIHQAREIKIKSAAKLEEAFRITRKNGDDTVSLVLNINSLHFKKGNKFRASNFDHIGDDPNPIQNEDEIDIEIEDNTGKEDHTTTSAMIDMMKKLVDTISLKEKVQSPETNPMSMHNDKPISLKNFNINGLQEDVKERVYNRRNRSYKMPHTEMVPFETDIPDLLSDPSGKTNRKSISHFVTPNVLVMRDGNMFRAYTEKAIEKRFTHDTPEFDSNRKITPATLRMWYKRFVAHGLSSGVYVHPYYCFRPTANSDHGFTCGTDTECERFDLPSTFGPALDRWGLLIGTAIQNVFPKGTYERNICNHNVTDGYAALRNLVITHHPSFHEHGPSMAIYPPLQSKRTDIFEHYEIYNDHLEMKAFTQNISTNLDDPDQMTNFILSCRYGDQILLKTREERRSKIDLIQQKWKSGQITSTMAILLESLVDKTLPPFPDTIKQPRVPDPSPNKYKHSPSKYSPRKRENTRDRNRSRTPTKQSPSKAIKVNHAAIQQIESLIPEVDNDDDQYKVAIYKLALHTVKKTGNFDVAQKCLVCQKTGHTFDECPILNNHELLKKLHISFCSMCKRMQRQSEENDTHSIHGVTVSDVEASESSSSSDDDNESAHTYYHDESDYEPDF